MTTLRSIPVGQHFMTACSHRFGVVRSIKGLKYGCGVRVVLERPDGSKENRVLAPETIVLSLPSLGPIVPRKEGYEPKSQRDVYEPEWAPVHCSIPGRY